MASTYTTRARLEKQGDGENDDTWGTKLNTVLDLIDEGMEGYLAKSVAGSSDITLTSSNSASDESRQAVLKFTGALTGNINVIVPAVEKKYIVWNATSGNFTLTFKPSGGTGLVIPQGFTWSVFTDGSTMFSTTRGSTQKRVYTANDTWTKPAGLIAIDVVVVGGGGGGGGCAASGASESAEAGGGGGGGTGFKRILAASLGATETVTVGAGGTAGATGANNGSTGGTTSFGAHVTGLGGTGGTGSAATSTSARNDGGSGGLAGTADYVVSGSDGGTGVVITGLRLHSGRGGGSAFGGEKQQLTNAGIGLNYGGGGGGRTFGASTSAGAGYDGAPGICIVTEYF